MKASETLSAKVQVWFTKKRSASFRVPVARVKALPVVSRLADGTARVDLELKVLPWMRVMLIAIRALRALRLCHRVEISA